MERHTPLYLLAQQRLVNDIVSGVYQEGERLPSEWDLAEMYQMSQGTVRRAVNTLAGSGWLWREQGKGTFVAEPPSEWPVGVPGYLGEWSTTLPALKPAKILSVSRAYASDRIAEALSLRRAAALVQITQCWYVEKMPFALDEVFLPWNMASGMRINQLKEFRSIYRALSARHIRPVRFQTQSRSTLASREDMICLDVDLQDPLLELVVVAYDARDVPIEWRVRRMSTRHFGLIF